MLVEFVYSKLYGAEHIKRYERWRAALPKPALITPLLSYYQGPAPRRVTKPRWSKDDAVVKYVTHLCKYRTADDLRAEGILPGYCSVICRLVDGYRIFDQCHNVSFDLPHDVGHPLVQELFTSFAVQAERRGTDLRIKTKPLPTRAKDASRQETTRREKTRRKAYSGWLGPSLFG